MNVARHPAPRLADTHRLPTPDQATLQALYDLQRAVNRLDRLNRVDVTKLAPAQKGPHIQALDAAQWNRRNCRIALEQMLTEDV